MLPVETQPLSNTFTWSAPDAGFAATTSQVWKPRVGVLCCAMASLFSLPVWLPWWVPLVIAVPVLLYALVFLLMPFSVFGVISRLDGLEARLDEIQGEIRGLALRLPEPGREMAPPEEFGNEETYEPPPRPRPARDRPPIPPAPVRAERVTADDRRRATGDEAARPPLSGRAEPRLNWPR